MTTSKYQVTLLTPGYHNTPMAWSTRRDGRPTARNLQRYVEGFEASTREGGVNAHLGPVTVTSATITLNGQSKHVVAKYEAPKAPLFMIVTTDFHNVQEG